MFGGNTNQGSSLLNVFSDSDSSDGCNFGHYFKLSYKTRLYLFVGFAVIGLILSVIGTMLLFTLKIVPFAILYTFGNISMILATLFLFGPVKQIKDMCSSGHRIAAVVVYFGVLILTLVVAFTTKNAGLCLLLVGVQTVAYVWYTITSIPGGQTVCAACCRSAVSV